MVEVEKAKVEGSKELETAAKMIEEAKEMGVEVPASEVSLQPSPPPLIGQ